MKLRTLACLAGLISIIGLFAFAAPAWARIDYHGFYFVEDDVYNIHYLSELAGDNNLVKLSYDHLSSNPQALADEIRVDKYTAVDLTFGLTEPLFTNANGARDAYLSAAYQKLYVNSNMGQMLVSIQVLEEEYTLLHQGKFDSWSVFQNLNLADCQAKYHDTTLNMTNCRDYTMRDGLTSYIDSIHKYFPGIPTVIVENFWGAAYMPPSNLDVLGLDAYFIPTSSACDSTQRGLFDSEVTSLVNIAEQYGRPIQLVGGVFNSAPYTMLSQCQAQWYIDLAENTPQITSFNWFLYATVDGVGGVRNDPSGLVNYLKQQGRLIVNRKPVITNTSISSPQVMTNAKDTYDISVTTSDADGSDDIKVQYSVINQLYQGPNSGQYRGYLGWTKDGDMVQNYFFPGISGNMIPCTGGGSAAKATGYGEQYINLISCRTSISGNSRTTVFTVTFNSNFTSPAANNSISGWSADTALARSTWVTFGTFGLYPDNAPVITAASISSPSVRANATDTYNISITAADKDGGGDIRVEYALINQLYQGPNSGQYRGYLGWTKDGDMVSRYYFPGLSGNMIPCTGGGSAAKATGYGEQYINLLSCSTSITGNSRTTIFTVSFNSSFTTPTAGNSIAGWAADAAIARSTWVMFDSFSLMGNNKPIITNASISSPQVIPDAKTTYNISVTTSDADGSDDIKVQYAGINLYQGPNAGAYRGYLGWTKDGDMVQNYYFPGISGSMIGCTGGGSAAKAIGYGEQYINLISCSTSITGNSRTTTFTVSFNPNFTIPATSNTIAGWSADGLLNRSTWVTFGTFDLK